MHSRGRFLLTSSSILLAALLLYLALRGVDFARVWTVVSSARPALIAAGCCLGSIAYLMRSLRWRVLLNTEAQLGLPAVFWANMAGYLGNNLLPARAGELVRTVLISARFGLSRTFVLTTAFAERLVDSAVLVLVSLVLLSAVADSPPWLRAASRWAGAFAIAGLLLLAFLPRAGRHASNLVARLPVPRRIHNRLATVADELIRGVQTFHDARRLAAFLAYTTIIWLLDAWGCIVGALALHLDMSLTAALLLIAALALGSSLPSTPGYVGIYQFAAVTVLSPFGWSRSDALAYILVVQAFSYLVIGLWGGLGIWRFRIGYGTLIDSVRDPPHR